MRVFVIINPKAGGGKAQACWSNIRDFLKRSIGSFDYALTTAPRDAIHLAQKAIAQGAELIIAVGGDGTTNEVANGFVDLNGCISRESALAIIPCGTGSDFCRTIGLTSDPVAAITRIVENNERLIDIGLVGFHSNAGALASRMFLNIASFGLSGAISHNMQGSVRLQRFSSKMTYLVETFRALYSYQPVSLRLTVDDNLFEREVMFVAVANGRYFGGGMMVAPNADPQDGLLDVIVLKAISKTRLARKIALVYRGSHLELPEIEVFRGSKITAEVANRSRETPVFLEVDGENPGYLDSEFTVKPKALRLAQ